LEAVSPGLRYLQNLRTTKEQGFDIDVSGNQQWRLERAILRRWIKTSNAFILDKAMTDRDLYKLGIV